MCYNTLGDKMNRSNIEKIAQTSEDRMLLAKLWDKITSGITRSIPAHTPFLTPRELEMARYLFGNAEGIVAFGGYDGSERKMLCYLPEYLDESYLKDEDSPVVCLHAVFYENDTPSHRDFLGSLMGCGVAREAIGDICVGTGFCDFFVTEEIAPYLLQNFSNAGRTKFHLSAVSLRDAQIPEPEVKIIKDTLASLRLDAVVSSGFRISRSLAAQYILAGKAAVDGLPCEKPDKQVTEGCKISIRGSGKIKLYKINGQTKKNRISVEIHRYV
jgi:RNA-binding protein YlmH